MASLYEKNRKLLFASQEFCAICGEYVDKELKSPHPGSPEADHIIPKDKGGKDTLDNLQLSHRKCNRDKSDKLDYQPKAKSKKRVFEQLVEF